MKFGSVMNCVGIGASFPMSSSSTRTYMQSSRNGQKYNCYVFFNKYLPLNILLIADIVSKIISLVIFVCLAMWSIRNLKNHDVSYATAILRQVIKTIVSKGLLYFTGGPAERSIIRSIIGTITPNAYWSTHTVIDQSPRPLVRPLVRLMHQPIG